MLQFLLRRWFLILLFVVIPLGLYIGYSASPDRVRTFPKYLVTYASGGLTALILFLMSSTLENHKLIQSFRSPGPVLWGSLVNYVLVPLLALPLLTLQKTMDFRIGLMVAASVPSTLAAASVWTRKAKGNDAVSLLVTMLTNSICFLVTPLWLTLGLSNTVHLDPREMMVKLFLSALLPISVGQVMRQWTAFRTFADRGKGGFGALAQICILAIIFWGSIQGGNSLKRTGGAATGPGLGGGAVIIVWGSCIAVHLTAALTALLGARYFRFSREDATATIFAGSQKTLPIGIFVADIMMQLGYPFASLPMLMYHSSQLLIDTLFVGPLSAWIDRSPSQPPGPPVVQPPVPEPLEEV